MDPRAQAHGIIDQLHGDDLEVARLLLVGLYTGRAVYGELHVRTDSRDFLIEAVHEARDLLVYLTAEGLRRSRA